MDTYQHISESLFRASNRRKELQKENDARFKEESKRRLKTNAEKKMKTTFIGAIDSIEKKFGHLWGRGKTQLSPSERNWAELWEELRKEILDKGNNQLRNLKNEIDEYEVEWQKYHYEFRGNK